MTKGMARNSPLMTLMMQALMAVAVCFLAASAGNMLTIPNLDWYETLAKPGFTPPDSVFAPVWTVLYALMAVALFLVWRAPEDENRRLAFIWFGIQLVLNVAWSGAFFHLQSPALGFLVVMLLLGAIAITIAMFHRVSAWAALLLLPYLLWVAFAAVLNLAIWIANA